MLVLNPLPTPVRGRPPRPRGTTLVEIIAAGAILAVLLVVCAQMIARAAVQQRAIAHRRAALQTASNAIERLRDVAWSELDEAAADAVSKAVLDRQMLKGARLDIDLDESKEAPRGKRIRVTVSWCNGHDRVKRTQQLTAWRYPGPPGNAGGEGSAQPASSGEEGT